MWWFMTRINYNYIDSTIWMMSVKGEREAKRNEKTSTKHTENTTKKNQHSIKDEVMGIYTVFVLIFFSFLNIWMEIIDVMASHRTLQASMDHQYTHIGCLHEKSVYFSFEEIWQQFLRSFLPKQMLSRICDSCVFVLLSFSLNKRLCTVVSFLEHLLWSLETVKDNDIKLKTTANWVHSIRSVYTDGKCKFHN